MSIETPILPPLPATFQGHVRAEGRVGTRNCIGVLVVGNCGATAARKVAEHFSAKRLASYPQVDGVLPFVHELGCGMEMTGEPMNLLRRTLAGTIRHPNLAGAVVIALGCERNNIRGFFEQEQLQTGPLLHMIVMQEVGGTAKAIGAGIAAVQSMLPLANASRRQTVSAAHLMMGLQSEAINGDTARSANPVLGAAVDLLVQAGGTVILSETCDLARLPAALRPRSATAEVAQQLEQRIEWWTGHTAGRDTGLTRRIGAEAPGFDSPEEQSRAGLMRAGSTALQAVYNYAQPITHKGLVLMDAPSYAAVSATGQIASGANLITLTTGLGSGFGTPAVPTLKLASDSALFRQLEDDLDMDCGPALDDRASVQALGHQLFERWLSCASGAPTQSELLGIGANEFVPWPIGVLA